MASAALIESIHNGNLHKSVPESMYIDNLAATYQSLKDTIPTLPIKFDPLKHLQYYADSDAREKFSNTRTISMEELGLTSPLQISETGVSDPFPLFTDEAVDLMRSEILNKETFMKYSRYIFNSSSGMDCTIRGYVKNDNEITCPFTYEAWTHPKTMELVNKMAGVELEIIMDYEIAHVNVSMKSSESVEELIKKSRERAMSGDSNGDDIPAVVGWHHDSYPFVCVLMLSDTTNMIGGETSLRMGGEHKGKVVSVPGPKSGSAAVLQGRLIEHIAPVPLGMSERITMVTSYRAKDPTKGDESVLSTVKPEINYGTRFDSFYSQWVDYRVGILKERLDIANRTSRDENGRFKKEETMAALKEIEAYLAKTYKEMEVSEDEWARAAK
ncbi:uncharacterized protein RJT20DRAFT_5154 [Scheffersomyces xylosifermentans]|uniref:uncharacterized protein n=1 Tax=Scheffersomyces xylosifermentans TaxID=1304137 RepID=UPI00315D8218